MQIFGWTARLVALSIAGTGMAAAREPVRPEPITSPAGWITQEDYPAPALREGAEGSVVYKLDIDSAGSIVKCTILQGSGTTYLDEATCATIWLRARFRPARDAQDTPVVSSYVGRVRWAMPPGTKKGPDPIPVDFFPGTIRIVADLDAAGRPEKCELKADVTPLAKSILPDICAELNRKGTFLFVDKQAKPVATHVELSVSAAITPR